MKTYAIACLLTLLAACCPAAEPSETTRLLLISQEPDGHPWNTHEFRAGVRILEQLLSAHKDLRITTIDSQANPAAIPAEVDAADGVVLFVSQGGMWVGSHPERLAAFRRLAARGGGITVLHWAVGAKDEKYIEVGRSLWGGVHGGPDRKYVVETQTLTPNSDHPITAGLEPITVRDEWYHRLKFATEPPVTPLWTATINGQPEVVSWAWERPDGGRSFGFVGLHFHENWGEETYRRFVTRGVLWTVNLRETNGGLPLEFSKSDLETPRPKPDTGR